jgi:hypothetical protein
MDSLKGAILQLGVGEGPTTPHRKKNSLLRNVTLNLGIGCTQDKDQWWDLVNMAMNLRVP